jgi:hypothetical protein
VLEARRPVYLEDAPPGLLVLPLYVSREHDRLLGQVVGAAEERRSGITVLIRASRSSTSGRYRRATEAWPGSSAITLVCDW